MKRADLRIGGHSGAAAVTLLASRPRLPDVGLELTPRAGRELIRLLEEAVTIAEGNAVTRRADDGEAVAWRESMGASLAAFVPVGGIR